MKLNRIFSETKILLVCLWLLFSNRGIAQSIEDQITDIEPKLQTNIPYSSFGGVVTDVINLNNNYFVCPGVTAGMIFNHKYLIAGYANFLLNHTHVKTTESVLFDISYEYGGIWLGYIANPIRNIQFGASSKFGKGNINLFKDDKNIFKERNLLMVTPQLDVHLRCTKWMKIYFSTGYRFTADLHFDAVNQKYFSGPNTTIGIIFGECGQSYCF